MIIDRLKFLNILSKKHIYIIKSKETKTDESMARKNQHKKEVKI